MRNILDDPSEWPAEFVELKYIDSLLRCSICSEFLNIAMIVPACSHNYCSLCIRKHVIRVPNCPTCFKPMLDTDLKCNRVLDEIVNNFKLMRTKLIAVTRKYIKIASAEEGTRTETATRNQSQNSIMGSKDDDSDDSAFENLPAFRSPVNAALNRSSKSESKENCRGKATKNEKVNCPSCNSKLPVKYMNSHLDDCLNNGLGTSRLRSNEIPSSQSNQPNRASMLKRRKIEQNLPSTDKVRKPLPKICLSLLSEKQLHKKAESYGLNTKGEKKELMKRIEHYILLYNSQCDSPNPMDPAMISKQVEESERAMLKYGSTPSVLIHTHDLRYSKEEKEEFNRKYFEQHEGHYERLIKEIKDRPTVRKPNSNNAAVNMDELVENINSNIKSEVNNDFSIETLHDYSEIIDHTTLGRGDSTNRKVVDLNEQREPAEEMKIDKVLGSGKTTEELRVNESLNSIRSEAISTELDPALQKPDNGKQKLNSKALIQNVLNSSYFKAITNPAVLNTTKRDSSSQLSEKFKSTEKSRNLNVSVSDSATNNNGDVESLNYFCGHDTSLNKLLNSTAEIIDLEKSSKLNTSKRKVPIRTRDIGSFFKSKRNVKITSSGNKENATNTTGNNEKKKKNEFLPSKCTEKPKIPSNDAFSPIILSDDMSDNSNSCPSSPSPSLLSTSEQPYTYDFNPLKEINGEICSDMLLAEESNKQTSWAIKNIQRNELSDHSKSSNLCSSELPPNKFRVNQENVEIENTSCCESDKSFDLSSEINRLVENAIENPPICSSISSIEDDCISQRLVVSDTDDSEIDNEEHSISLIPRPPSALNFTVSQ